MHESRIYRVAPALRLSALTLALAGFACPAAAEDASEADDATLKEVVVTATRSSQAVDVIPGTVTTVERKTLEQRQAKDIVDVLAQEPDVAVPVDQRRFGAGQVNIRGIEGNRILLMVDGVRATDYRGAGSTNYDSAGRDLPDVDFLKQVEIVRGPGSSLYGSDAIGGIIGFLTLDPADLLKDGQAFAKGVKAGYYAADDSTRVSAHLAGRGERFEGLLMVAHAQGHETDNQGDVAGYGFYRTEPNPQDYESTAVLGKLGFKPAPGHNLKVTAEGKHRDTETDIQRIANLSGTSLSRIASNLGDDVLDRWRLSVDYDYLPSEPTWYDRLAAKVYRQTQESENDNYQLRADARLASDGGGCSASSSGTDNCDVRQRFDFEQSHAGASMVMEKEARWGVPQYLTWGGEWLRSTTQEVKDTVWTNLATGVSSNYFLGEFFPKSDFPEGHMDQLGLFVQDEFKFAGGRWRLTPGLRYDSYTLSPDAGDPLYAPKFGAAAVGKDGDHLSAKLSTAYDLHDGWNVYGQYVEGFRPPNYEEVNRYFYNNSSFYGVIGNPDLEPETSRGVELGIKFARRNLGAQLAVYKNRYKNFIDYVRLADTDPNRIYDTGAGVYRTTYQYQNLSSVAIRGVELRGYWQALPALRLNAAYAFAHGDDESNGVPLNSIEPQRFTASAQWTPDERYGAELRLRAAAGVDRVDDSSLSSGYFKPDGYAVVDVSGWWRVHRSARLGVGVNNLFDKKYWLWSDVRNASLSAADPAPHFYTQPGRSFTVTLQAEF